VSDNEKSNVVSIKAWQQDKQLKEQQREIDARQPIVVPEHITAAAEEYRARQQRLGMCVVERVIDEVPKAADSDTTSTGPEFHYDE
jgi:hypothetical protein